MAPGKQKNDASNEKKRKRFRASFGRGCRELIIPISSQHQRTPSHSDRRYVTTTSRFVVVFILFESKAAKALPKCSLQNFHPKNFLGSWNIFQTHFNLNNTSCGRNKSTLAQQKTCVVCGAEKRRIIPIHHHSPPPFTATIQLGFGCFRVEKKIFSRNGGVGVGPFTGVINPFTHL